VEKLTVDDCITEAAPLATLVRNKETFHNIAISDSFKV